MTTARLEIDIPFGGKTFSVRPTFEKLILVEAITNQPCRDLGMKMLEFRAGLTEIAAVLGAILKGEKDEPPTTEIGNILMDGGYTDLMLPLGQFLTRAQKGNKQHVKEIEEEAKRASAPADPPKPAGS